MTATLTAVSWVLGVASVIAIGMTVSLGVALVVGRAVRNRDRQTPRDEP